MLHERSQLFLISTVYAVYKTEQQVLGDKADFIEVNLQFRRLESCTRMVEMMSAPSQKNIEP